MYRRVIEIAVTIVISERTPNATLANAALGALPPLLRFQGTGGRLREAGDGVRATQHSQMPGLQRSCRSIDSLHHGRLECRSDGPIVARNYVPAEHILPYDVRKTRIECVLS